MVENIFASLFNIFTHLGLCVAVATHNVKWVKIRRQNLVNHRWQTYTKRVLPSEQSVHLGVFLKHPGDLFTHGNDMPGGPVQHD